MPDPLLYFAELELSTSPDSGLFHVLSVCAWSDDEPMMEFIGAAKNVNEMTVCSSIK